jgi:CRP/FNR family transcriptional regulator
MSEGTPISQRQFPGLDTEDPGVERALSSARLVALAAGEPVFHAGAACQAYLLVVEGRVRVQVISEAGREAVLYRVGPGQSCVLTTTCMLSGERYPAEGYAETAVRALAFSRPDFDRAVEESPAFRRFVFANLGQRLAEVIVRIEEVAFRPVDRRLAAFLLGQAGSGTAVTATHQAIALELGTAREVVSRHLKRLETQGLLRLGRSAVEILDRPRLEALAQEGV